VLNIEARISVITFCSCVCVCVCVCVCEGERVRESFSILASTNVINILYTLCPLLTVSIILTNSIT
jgi:hypothetical protein